MKEYHSREYDGYVLPEAPKKVTPEMKVELKKCMERIKEMAKRFDKQDELSTRVS